MYPSNKQLSYSYIAVCVFVNIYIKEYVYQSGKYVKIHRDVFISMIKYLLMTIIGYYLKKKLQMCYHLSFCFITKHFVDWNINTHLEPINCTATNQGWKHAKSIPEGISNGTHGQYYMKVLFNTLNEEIIHCKRGGINFFSLKLNKLKKYKCAYSNWQEK